MVLTEENKVNIASAAEAKDDFPTLELATSDVKGVMEETYGMLSRMEAQM